MADNYGFEPGRPVREGRRPGQIGKKGKSNHRWPRIGVRGDAILGGKLYVVLNRLDLFADWDCATTNAHDQIFRPLLVPHA